MSDHEFEKLTDDMTQAVKTGQDVSNWQKNSESAPLLSVITELNNLPRSAAPSPDMTLVRAQIMKRISIPTETARAGFMAMWPSILRVGFGTLASVLIVISLGMGTAVAALQSVPGQTIYPLKKIVENVELTIAPPAQAANLQLQFANNRLDELQQVINQNQQGKLSDQETQKIVAQTVQDFKQSTTKAAESVVASPTEVSKFIDLSNKLQATSVQTQGAVKAEIEQAIVATQVSQQQAIQNIENAGLKVDTQPITIPDTVEATGKITAVSTDSVSIGTSEFILSKDTQYNNINVAGLKIDVNVDIQGVVKDNETDATVINLVSDTQSNNQNGQSQTNTDTTGQTSGSSTTQDQTTTQQVPTITPPPQDIITIPDNQ